jgi:hyperosmotically inducible periplasmic protein
MWLSRRLWASLLVIAIGVALSACEAEKMNPPAGSPSGSTMSNSDLEKAIKDKLNSDPQLKAADLSVSADVQKNEATISGSVDSEALRSRAIDLTKSAHSNLMITDKIDVKPREATRASYTEGQAQKEREKAKSSNEKVGNSLDDAWIHMKVVGKLIGDSATPERKINVDVVDGIVTLRGTVDTAAQKSQAEMDAKSTDGVKRVDNQLKVGGEKTATRK